MKALLIFILSLLLFACSNQKQTTQAQEVVNVEETKNREEYKLFIINGDDAFKEKKYAEAKEYYKKALKVSPNELYPVSQIEKIDILLNLDKKEESFIEFDEEGFKLFEDSINKLKKIDYKFNDKTNLFPNETFGKYFVLYEINTSFGVSFYGNGMAKKTNECCVEINNDFKPKEFGEGPYVLTMYGDNIIVYQTKPSKSESKSFYLKRK